MRVAARYGNQLHAPAGSRIALLSAYTMGADVLQFAVRATSEGTLVVASQDQTEPFTGEPGTVSGRTLHDLRALDFSATFTPRGSPGFDYRRPGRAPVRVEILTELLDVLPDDVELLVGVGSAAWAQTVVGALKRRGLLDRTVVYSEDGDCLREVRRLSPAVRILLDAAEPDADDLRSLCADGALTGYSAVIAADGRPTALGARLDGMLADSALRVGAVLRPEREPAVFTEDEFAAATERPCAWALATDSLVDVAPVARPGWAWLTATFDGTQPNTRHFAFGYAKANRYCHVFQDDGVHVRIAEYDADPDPPPAHDPVTRRLDHLTERSWYALMDWPFYSGGGFGVTPPIRGEFAAEVDVAAERASQATMCEMAVVNAEPGAHQPPWKPDGSPNLPASARQKNVFFDPHGAPPFVGVEHDEDDGYRINWNPGTSYDGNQYGSPVGDGTVLSGRLRLERRGRYFAAYYRNGRDATDWVCVGVARNDSMNPTVFLRCAGKRWRQEDGSGGYFPVVPNEFVFRNLRITRHP